METLISNESYVFEVINHVRCQLKNQKDKSVSLSCHQKYVKLFKMLQDKHTNYSYIKLAVYVDITKILYENQNYNRDKSKSKKCHQELKFL